MEETITIKLKTTEQILARIKELDDQINKYKHYDQSLPDVQKEIRCRREQIRALCYVLSIPYDENKYRIWHYR